MSKNPYSAGRLLVYLAAAVVIGLGAAGSFSGCNDQDKNPACTQDHDGNPNCPLQTGGQDQ